MPVSFADKRARLFRPWALLLMAASVLGILAFLAPRGSFLTHPEQLERADALSVAYLRSLLRANPEDDGIRLKYAEQLADTGRIGDAARELAKLRHPDSVDQARLVFLSGKLALHALLSNPDDARLRRRAGEKLRRILLLPAEKVSLKQLKMLADLALQAGMPGMAARIDMRLAMLDAGHADQWMRKAVRWQLAANRPARAAAIQRRIAAGEKGTEEDALRVVRLTLAADGAAKAVRMLPVLLRKFPDSQPLMRLSLGVAMAASAWRQADQWGRAWLVRHPDDAEILRSLARVDIASGRPRAAYPLAERLARLRPEDPEARELLARIAEQTGRASVAFREWSWLARHRRRSYDLDRALTLASALRNYPAIRSMLREEARQGALSPARQSMLAWVQEKLGHPERSERARLTYLAQSKNDRASWEALARLQEYRGELARAARTWKVIEERFGPDVRSVTERARMLAATGRELRALRHVRRFARRRHPDDARFWKVYGDLAWNLEYHDDALKAYRWLWEHGREQSFEAQRLMILLRQGGDAELTLRISKEAWQRFHDPDVLLLAIESAEELGRPDDADRLLGMADRSPALFSGRHRYWLARARRSVRRNKLPSAEADYRRALELSPQNDDARVGLLWVWIDGNKRKLLRRHLPRWRRLAWKNNAYWAAFAAAYRELGRDGEALPWLRRIVRREPDDILWMLEYADTLDDAGRASAAWRLRRHIFAHVWPKSRMHPDYARRNANPVREAVAGMIRRLRGEPRAQSWVNQLLSRADDPGVREFAMRWYFGLGREDRAAWWLLRQHAARLLTPAWQQLALAMQRNDLDWIQRLVDGGSGLDHVSRMLAVRQLGRLNSAWTMAMDDGLGVRGFRSSERVTLRRHARDIQELQPNALHGGLDFIHFGPLELQGLKGRGLRSRDNVTWSLSGGATRLSSQAGFANLLRDDRETALRLNALRRFRHGSAGFHIGLNSRGAGGGRLWQWGGDFNWRPWQGGVFGLSLSMRETGMETPGFRLAGARSRARFRFASDLTNREYLDARLNLNRYRTRPGEPLGHGYSLEATFGHRERLTNSLAEEQTHAYLTALIMRNSLASSVTPYVRRLMPKATIDSILPASFASLGVGLNIQKDIPDNNPATGRTPVYLLDAWLGWQWPASQPAYALAFGVGAPLFGRDMLSLKFRLDHGGAGGIAGNGFYGLELWYGYRFGQ